jgi:hypothetical protein
MSSTLGGTQAVILFIFSVCLVKVQGWVDLKCSFKRFGERMTPEPGPPCS